MEFENEKEDNSNMNLSDISENEDEVSGKEIEKLDEKLSEVDENEEENENEDENTNYKNCNSIFETLRKINRNNKDLDITSNKSKDEIKGSNLRNDKISNPVRGNVNKDEIDEDEPGIILSDISDDDDKYKHSNSLTKTISNINKKDNDSDITLVNNSKDEIRKSNSALSDANKHECDEDEPGLILSDVSDDEYNSRKKNQKDSNSLSHGIKEKHNHDYKPMFPPKYTSNIYRSVRNYPEAFGESIVSEEPGSYGRYYTESKLLPNNEYDDSNYFSQSETSSHRDYSEELKYYKYRDRKKRDWSPDKEYYDDYKTERTIDNGKKSRHSRKKRRKDREISIDSDLDDKKRSHDVSENEVDEKHDSEFFYKSEKKIKKKEKEKY